MATKAVLPLQQLAAVLRQETKFSMFLSQFSSPKYKCVRALALCITPAFTVVAENLGDRSTTGGCTYVHTHRWDREPIVVEQWYSIHAQHHVNPSHPTVDAAKQCTCTVQGWVVSHCTTNAITTQYTVRW